MFPSCKICGSTAGYELDLRPRVPIGQNLLFRSAEEAAACPVGTLRMVRCAACGFAWNAAFDPGLVRYDADYENGQAHSPAFAAHVDAVAQSVARRLDASGGATLLEVGCGQGDFLNRLATVIGTRTVQMVGFDPAFRVTSAVPSAARIEHRAFTAEAAAGLSDRPGLVVSRHVIEHVPDPLAFLRAIRSACDEGVPLFVETPDVQWILDGAVAHDLYYEHCSLFDRDSLRLALELAGFAVEAVEPCFGRQYLLATAVAAAEVSSTARLQPTSNSGYPSRKTAALDALRTALRADMAAGEAVALWGGASKGVTLALLLEEDIACLEAAIDINPARWATFMPVTALPVIAAEQAQARGITKAYVCNPLYLDEIAEWCERRGWPLKLSPIG